MFVLFGCFCLFVLFCCFFFSDIKILLCEFGKTQGGAQGRAKKKSLSLAYSSERQ